MMRKGRAPSPHTPKATYAVSVSLCASPPTPSLVYSNARAARHSAAPGVRRRHIVCGHVFRDLD